MITPQCCLLFRKLKIFIRLCLSRRPRVLYVITLNLASILEPIVTTLRLEGKGGGEHIKRNNIDHRWVDSGYGLISSHLDHMLITESDIYGTWQFKHWGLLFSGKKDTKTKTSRESKGTSKFKRFCKGKLVLENELKWTLISIFITKKKPSEVYNR